jgi:protein TonB
MTPAMGRDKLLLNPANTTHASCEVTMKTNTNTNVRDGAGNARPNNPSQDHSLLDVLIDNPRRPKKAEGKDHKAGYRMTLMIGLVLSLGSMTGLMRADLQRTDDGLDIQLQQQETVQMEEIEQTTQEMKAPPPPRPPIPVEVPNDVVFDDVELDLDVTLDLDAEILDIPPPPPTPVDEAVEEEEPEIFVVVEQMPTIVGGNARIYELLDYPEIARQAGMEGMVVVQVVIQPDGTPADPIIARSAGDVLDEAATKAVMKLTFVPGKQRGKAVSVRLAIPIRFRLKEVQQK